MANKFSIGVVITALDKASPIIKHVGQAAKGLQTGVGKLGAALTSMPSLLSGIATGMVASKVLKFGQSFIDSTSMLKDFSRQIDWTAEDLQKWRYAARMAGVEGETFDKSLTLMTRNLGNLKAKSGPLYAFLKGKGDVGFLKQLMDASGPEALDLLIGKMEQLPTAEAQAAFATAAFGKSGMDMIRMAKEGRAALSGFRAEAVRLGLVIDNDTVNAAEDFGDTIDTLKGVLGGVGATIMGQLVPGMNKGAKGMVEWVAKNRELIATKVVDFLRSFWEHLSSIGAWLSEHKEGLFTAFESGADILSDIVGVAKDIGKAFSELPEYLQAAAKGIGVVAAASKIACPELKALLAALLAIREIKKAIEEDASRAYTEDIQNRTGVRTYRDQKEMQQDLEAQALRARANAAPPLKLDPSSPYMTSLFSQGTVNVALYVDRNGVVTMDPPKASGGMKLGKVTTKTGINTVGGGR